MIPAAFDYLAPTSLDDALEVLSRGIDDLKVMAGGQSLIPLLKLRLAEPGTILDISRLRDQLGAIQRAGDVFRIGALATHAEILANSDLVRAFPILADAGNSLADLLVRNRGTFGGAIAHADPAGDWPAAALALGGIAVVNSSARGERRTDIDTFFTFLFTADLEDDELLTHVEIPAPSAQTLSAYHKIPHPGSGYSVAAAGVRLSIDPSGRCTEARIALTGVSTTPVRARGAENTLIGNDLSEPILEAAAAAAPEGLEVVGDAYAPTEYRTNLISVVTRRAIDLALSRRDS